MVYDHDGIPCYLREYTYSWPEQAEILGIPLKEDIL